MTGTGCVSVARDLTPCICHWSDCLGEWNADGNPGLVDAEAGWFAH
jgi:hypothetical protein